MDCSLPGSSVHGIFQAIVLEWIAISFSRRSSQPRDWTWVSHIIDRCFTVWATREVLYAQYIMWNASLDEACIQQAGFKIVRRNINNLSYADDTTLMVESKEELKSLLMKVKEESEKVGLKCNVQKTKILASSPIQSVQSLSRVRFFLTPWIAGLLHVRPPCPSPTPGVYSDSHPSSRWCHPAISSSVVPFSSCPQSLPASESFPMSQLFTWGGQSTGVSALASFLPKNTQNWSLEWTGWISLQSKGLSRVFSNTTVQKHQFFGTQLSSQSNSHIHTWPLEKP